MVGIWIFIGLLATVTIISIAAVVICDVSDYEEKQDRIKKEEKEDG